MNGTDRSTLAGPRGKMTSSLRTPPFAATIPRPGKREGGEEKIRGEPQKGGKIS